MIPGNAAGSDDAIVRGLQEFHVAGIFEVGPCRSTTSVLALVNLEDAEAFRKFAGPAGIRLKFYDVLLAPQLAKGRRRAARVRPRGRDWTEENQAYFRAIRIEKTMMD